MWARSVITGNLTEGRRPLFGQLFRDDSMGKGSICAGLASGCQIPDRVQALGDPCQGQKPHQRRGSRHLQRGCDAPVEEQGGHVHESFTNYDVLTKGRSSDVLYGTYKGILNGNFDHIC